MRDKTSPVTRPAFKGHFPPTRKPLFLASVSTAAEAELCVDAGADIIDGKDPSQGALGALNIETIRAIREAVPRPIPVSVTLGDRPANSEGLIEAIRAVAATEVDYIKIGMFPDTTDPAGPSQKAPSQEETQATIARLGRLDLGRTRLVGVLLADLEPVWSLVAHMADAGFAGILLDTAGKSGRALPEMLPFATIQAFVRDTQKRGLFAGLAGSLRLIDISKLAAHTPDILGFRGALCRNGNRIKVLDPMAVLAVASALGKAPPIRTLR